MSPFDPADFFTVSLDAREGVVLVTLTDESEFLEDDGPRRLIDAAVEAAKDELYQSWRDGYEEARVVVGSPAQVLERVELWQVLW